jgi:hypothetical protein
MQPASRTRESGVSQSEEETGFNISSGWQIESCRVDHVLDNRQRNKEDRNEMKASLC